MTDRLVEVTCEATSGKPFYDDGQAPFCLYLSCGNSSSMLLRIEPPTVSLLALQELETDRAHAFLVCHGRLGDCNLLRRSFSVVV